MTCLTCGVATVGRRSWCLPCRAQRSRESAKKLYNIDRENILARKRAAYARHPALYRERNRRRYTYRAPTDARRRYMRVYMREWRRRCA